MQEFAESTGLTGTAAPERYLWTDAFAVCNYLGFSDQSDNNDDLQLAEALIDQVHHVLGRHRPDDSRTGWISGLSEDEGEQHPTRGGLRIGKKRNERAEHEPADPQAEWDRDGQYFHYLTKWMHALRRAFQETGKTKYLEWAAELAVAAHGAFVVHSSGRGLKRMVWKMSIDLSRPLVASMGHHDPLDGLLTSLELIQTPDVNRDLRTSLEQAAADYDAMCDDRFWATDDALGIGGLLDSIVRLLQIDLSEQPHARDLLHQLLQETAESLRVYSRSAQLSAPADYRLAFRELGLSIGLRGLELFSSTTNLEPPVAGQLEDLLNYRGLADQIESFWSDSTNRQSRTWQEHRHINSVMLATSLEPAGYFGTGAAM
jgi:hypothetical protein